MAKNTVNIRYLLLGLLTEQPMTGYDIKGLLESYGWLIGSPSYGSLYPALHGLLDDGLVAVNVVSHEEKPSRKVYRVTDAGRQALEEWINIPVVKEPSMKTFLLRLILAKNYSREGLVAYLHHRRSQVAERHNALKKKLQTNQKGEPGFQPPLALDYGLAMAKQELKWLEKTLEQLS